ncbi:MAG: NAD(P)H-binding protein [Chitinivibrionales bacterium]|nr:NAD(P)H-binding protein [Chitinivibrionales bacterium]
MKLVIFGATGRTGIPLVGQALDKGHRTKAFVRTPEKLTIEHRNLEVVQGDVLDAGAVEKALAGTEGVLCVIGHTKDSPTDLQTRAMMNITSAMKKKKVKRLVDLTGAGVRDSSDRPKLIDRLIVVALKLISPKVLNDGRNHAEVIRSSGVEWTIVRAPMLQDGPHTGKYRVGFVGRNSGTKISRADVADFMLKEIEKPEHSGTMPMVSY